MEHVKTRPVNILLVQGNAENMSALHQAIKAHKNSEILYSVFQAQTIAQAILISNENKIDAVFLGSPQDFDSDITYKYITEYPEQGYIVTNNELYYLFKRDVINKVKYFAPMKENTNIAVTKDIRSALWALFMG